MTSVESHRPSMFMNADEMSSNQRRHSEFVRDGGFYGWLVVFGSYVCCVFAYGAYVAIGIFFVAIQQSFQVTSVRVSWILSVQIFLQMILGPLASICVENIGYRLTVGIGTLVSSLGLFLNAFAQNVEFLYFSFGVLVGVGYSLTGSPSLGIIPLYINKRYAVANALSLTGAGTGSLALGTLMQALIGHYGWRGAFIVFSAINAQMGISAALFRYPDSWEKTRKQ
ncbi:monocarboxylate transporter 13-like [Ptychodera flava]|uniref:monocarboxylate transporter 13-like n=1 Tax=Ptychodera flava TaxID=63121 RepID=UPI00396A38E4